MSFRVVIPARYASSRLPGKALADIAGKPMVVRVAERARASGADAVWIATDHEAIASAARSHGFEAVMTRCAHASGTDRIAEAAAILGWDDEVVVVNVQGDEPLIDPALIGHVARALSDDAHAGIATAGHRIERTAEFFDPNVVKLVCDEHGHALYFSRAPIPWAREAFAGGAGATAQLPPGLPARRHIGIYAYRVGFLKRFAALDAAPIERFEALEQLRALWHGVRIRVVEAAHAPAFGVDTPEDLERVRRKFDE